MSSNSAPLNLPPRNGPRPQGVRRKPPPTPARASSGKWWILGTVGFAVFILVLMVTTKSSPPERYDAPADSTDSSAPPPGRPDEREVVEEPNEDPTPTAEVTDSLPDPALVVEPLKERVEATSPPDSSARRSRLAAAAKRRLEDLNAAAAEVDDPTEAAPPQENRFFTLSLSGVIGEQPIDPNENQTWARLGYFLSEEASSRFFLVFPGGRLPMIQKAGTKAKAVDPRKEQKDRPIPAGDLNWPTYRLSIDAKATAGGSVSFYGQSLASKYECKMTCTVEKRVGDDFRPVESFAVEEKLTPAKGRKETSAEFVRVAYDAALEKLIARLRSCPPFSQR